MAALKWLLASGNPGKLREFRQILAPYGRELVSLADLDLPADAPETGETFHENAVMKAAYYQKATGYATIADDSGLVIDALGGRPGVFSARFGGFATHDEKRAYVLSLMHDVPQRDRTARFACVSVYDDGVRCLSAYATVEGFITLSEQGTQGFGYDAIFCPKWGGPTMAQLDSDTKNSLSHRGKALSQLVNQVMDSHSNK